MLPSHDLEEQVVAAVKSFAISVNAGDKVMADMSHVVEATSQLPLSNLDYWERLIRSEYSSAIQSSTKSMWKLWSKPSQLLTWLDLISWDGHKREKTLRTITGAAPNSFFFALAIRRLNDWVPQVRKAAREKLLDIGHQSDPAHVAEAISVTLSHWTTWGRIELQDKEVLLEMLTNKYIENALKLKIISSAAGPMVSLLAQVGRSPVLDEHLEEIANDAVQPSVRAKAYRSQFEERMVWLEGRKWEWTDIRYCKGSFRAVVGERKIIVKQPLIELLQKATDDSSSIVRRVAADFLIRELDSLGDKSRYFANRFASDQSHPVAERGRFALKKLDGTC